MSAEEGFQLRARPLAQGGPVAMPREFETRRLLRRALQVVLALGVLVLAVVLAPGLGEVRDKLSGAQPGWSSCRASPTW